MRLATRIASITVLAAALAGCGITAPKSNPGYADLDSPGVFDTDRTMALSLGPTVLRFAARHVEEDDETKELLRSLDGVRVRIYEIDGDVDKVVARLDRMSEKLREQDWQPVALIREDGESVHMLMKVTKDGIAGITVLVADESEAVLVNVMGDLKPELFSDTMVALDVDVTPDIQVVQVAATSVPGS